MAEVEEVTRYVLVMVSVRTLAKVKVIFLAEL